MKCENCGKELDEDAYICMYCGKPTKGFEERFGSLDAGQQVAVFEIEAEMEIQIKKGELNPTDRHECRAWLRKLEL